MNELVYGIDTSHTLEEDLQGRRGVFLNNNGYSTDALFRSEDLMEDEYQIQEAVEQWLTD